MAKSATKEKTDDQQILEALERAYAALPESMPLMGAKGKALFAKTQDRLVDEATKPNGYLKKVTVDEPPAKKKGKPKPVVYGVLTSRDESTYLNQFAPESRPIVTLGPAGPQLHPIEFPQLRHL